MGGSIALGRSRIALLGAEHLTEADLIKALQILRNAGAEVDLVGARSREISLLRHSADGVTEKVTLPAALKLNQIAPDEYQAVALPASLLEDVHLHVDADVRDFLAAMQAAGKLIVWLPAPAEPAVSPNSAVRPRAFSLRRLLADSWQNWNAINAPRLGAALAYYTLLSLAPLVILCVTITSLVFSRETIQRGLIAQVDALMGDSVALLVQSVLQHAKSATGVIAGALSMIMLLMGATGVFLELRDSLDTVWGVSPRYGGGLASLIRARLFAFLMILGTGLVVVSFFVLSTILSTPARMLLGLLPTETWLARFLTLGVAFAGMTFIFALVYRVIPDTSIRWSDVWIGALVTSALFTVGRLLIGLYLAHTGIASPYATAGSIILFLTWVYYSAQIFLLGAEFTHVYALRHGSYSRSSHPKWRSSLSRRS